MRSTDGDGRPGSDSDRELSPNGDRALSDRHGPTADGDAVLAKGNPTSADGDRTATD